jgi:ABC-type antimicrobial peptide transport system permease subunit
MAVFLNQQCDKGSQKRTPCPCEKGNALKPCFYKSGSLILIFSLVAMLFTLGGTALAKNTALYKPFPEQSDNSIIGRYSYTDETIGSADFYSSLADIGEQDGERFMIASLINGINSVAVYYSDDSLFQIDLISGETFSRKDFRNHADTVLINENMVSQCERRNGALWWRYNGYDFEVKGIYKSTRKNGDQTKKCYFNLLSDHIGRGSFPIFTFDADGATVETMERLLAAHKAGFPDLRIDYVSLYDAPEGGYIQQSVNFKAMEAMLLITALLVFLNTISVCVNWIDWRKKEISVRRLCGASNQAIFRWAVRHMLLFTGISIIIGLLLSRLFLTVTTYLPVAESTQLMFGNNFTAAGIMFSIGFILVLSVMIVTMSLSHLNKRMLAENLK